MPTYDYQCDACDHRFEKFHSITAAPIRKCPACAKNKVRRLIGTGAGMIFKGSGFYITDYRSEGYKESAKADSGTAAPAASGDAKPAASGNGATGGNATSSETKASKPADTSKKATAKAD